jgi:hypothetical protein
LHPLESAAFPRRTPTTAIDVLLNHRRPATKPRGHYTEKLPHSGHFQRTLEMSKMTHGNSRTAPAKRPPAEAQRQLFLFSRPPVLILIAAPFLSRLSRDLR